MMDLRYHLASLMSIFLALAVGIVVGISLGSSERQAATIRLLQRDVAAIRSEDTRLKEVNNDLQRRLARHEEAVEQDLLPVAVRGRLAGNRVALLLVGEGAEELRAPLTRALHLAGADLLILRLPRGEPAPDGSTQRPAGTSTGEQERGGGASWRVSHPRDREPFAPGESSRPAVAPFGRETGTRRGPRDAGGRGGGARSSPAASADDSPRSAETSAGLLARALLAGRPALLDEVRARIPALDVSGEVRAPIRRILLVCPNDQPDYAHRAAAGNGLEAAFARSAQAEGALLVAAEPETAPAAGTAPREATSLLPALAALGASTVDHVDSALGQIAAVLVLAGNRGNFGTGPGAARVLPLIESEERKTADSSSASRR